MPNSFATTTQLTCPQCGQSFSTELWLIVDVEERPDLAYQISQGTLHKVPCAKCKHMGTADMPLLLYRSSQPFQFQSAETIGCLVFSPALLFSPEQNQESAHQLLTKLAEQMGDDWRSEWLETVITVSRERLRVLLSENPDATLLQLRAERSFRPAAIQAILDELASEGVEILYEEELQQALIHRPEIAERLNDALNHELQRAQSLISQFVNSSSWNASKHVVQTNPELLSGQVDVLLEDLIDLQETERARNTLKEHRDLLRRCRVIGIDAAFAEKFASLDNISDHTLQDSPTEPADLPSKLFDLGNEQNNLYRYTGELGYLEEAIRLYQETLSLTEPGSPHLPFWLNNLADALSKRYKRTGEIVDLTEAIRLLRQGIAVADETFSELHVLLINLGVCLQYRYQLTLDISDLTESIRLCRKAVSLASDSEIVASYLGNLGAALRRRYLRVENVEDLSESIQVYRQALSLAKGDSSDLPLVLNNLGNALSDRYKHTMDLADLSEAIDCNRQAASLTDHNSPFLPSRLNNLAAGLRDLYKHGGNSHDLENAMYTYEQALITSRLLSPPETLEFARNWGNFALSEKSWKKASKAFGYGLDAVEDLLTRQDLRSNKESWLLWAQGIHLGAAYANARLVQWDATLEALERGQARLLAQSLEENRQDLAQLAQGEHADLGHAYRQAISQREALVQQLDDPAHRPSFEEIRIQRVAIDAALYDTIAQIQQIPGYEDFLARPRAGQIGSSLIKHGAAVYLLTTPVGGLALIVYRTSQKPGVSETPGFSIDPVWLDDFDEAALSALLVGPADGPVLGGYLGAYRRFRNNSRSEAARRAWFAMLDQTTHALWAQVMEPVAERLATLDRGDDGVLPVTLIPTGLLALLPLHAAWIEAGEGRHYFMDRFAVRYVPSARALSHALSRAQGNPAAGLLAVAEPKTSADPLPNTPGEVAAITDLFTSPLQLGGEFATKTAFLNALPHADLLHFGGHGLNDWDDPMQSGLLMANDEMLTVRDLLALRLGGKRLASLSACESGIPGAKLPDEVVNLPSALLQAGFGGVVASLWSVYDISTAMLMERFYRLWRVDGLEPVHALRQAQIWVRDTTNEEKLIHYQGLGSGIGESFWEAVWKHGAMDQRSFQHPVWWAAFTLTGV